MADQAKCASCGHLRRWHSKNGCGECPCPIVYMDKDKFDKK